MIDALKGLHLDHVAVAVTDLDAAQAFYKSLGLVFEDKREIVASEGVITAFAPMDTHAHLELLAPHGADGPIHQYLLKKGPGIHHLCFRVPDVEAKCKELAAGGVKLIYDKPRPGANNCLVNFIHPKSTGGVLIELSEKRGGV